MHVANLRNTFNGHDYFEEGGVESGSDAALRMEYLT